MFSKQERETLCKLSTELFGSKYKWQKLLSDPAYKVADGQEHNEDGQQYVQFNRSKIDTRPGTVMRREKAEQLGMVQSLPENVKGTLLVKSRAPSYDELLKKLEEQLEWSRISRLDLKDQVQVFAYKFVNNTMPFLPKFVEKDDPEYKKELEDVKAMLSEDHKAAIESNTLREPGSHGYDLLQFVTDCVFAVNNKEKAKEQYEEMLTSKGRTTDLSSAPLPKPSQLSGARNTGKNRSALLAKRKRERQNRKNGRNQK